MKRTFKGDAIFNHVDPHMARFVVAPIKEVIGMGPVNIKPDMFPEDFELAEYDVTTGIEFWVELKKKKKK